MENGLSSVVSDTFIIIVDTFLGMLWNYEKKTLPPFHPIRHSDVLQKNYSRSWYPFQWVTYSMNVPLWILCLYNNSQWTEWLQFISALLSDNILLSPHSIFIYEKLWHLSLDTEYKSNSIFLALDRARLIFLFGIALAISVSYHKNKTFV